MRSGNTAPDFCSTIGTKPIYPEEGTSSPLSFPRCSYLYPINYSCNVPQECCSFRKLFLILLCRRCYFLDRHIESVFALSLLKMWKFSEVRDIRTALISCVAMCDYALLCIISILSKCGALYRLFQFGSFHNLRLSRRIQLHTFFFFTDHPFGVGGQA